MQCLLLLNAALRCLMAIKNARRAIEHFFCFKYCCALPCEMLDSFDHSVELAQLVHAQSTLFLFNMTPEFCIVWGIAQELRKV